MSSLKDLIINGRVLAKSNIDLTPEMVSILGAIHGTLLENNGIIVIARDYRLDCRMLKRAYTSGAMSTGIDLLDLHAAPLPLLQFCIRRFGASGGVYFTSGHASYENTGIRFFNSMGIEFSIQEIKRLIAIWEKKSVKRVKPNDIGRISTIPHTAKQKSRVGLLVRALRRDLAHALERTRYPDNCTQHFRPERHQ
ncbi:MAG: hypothetical protein ACTSRA_15220 [Promethearchaeota archaeon]